MAAGDIYKVSWETAYAGQLMNNSLTYVQLQTPAGGGTASSHLALAMASAAGTQTPASVMLPLMADNAEITCARAKKIRDFTGTGADQSIAFFSGEVGTGGDGLPAHSTCVVNFTDQIVGGSPPRVHRCPLYLGALGETIQKGPFLQQLDWQRIYDNFDGFRSPDPDPGSIEIWQLVYYSRTLDQYWNMVNIDVPLWVSDRGSRRQSLCSI